MGETEYSETIVSLAAYAKEKRIGWDYLKGAIYGSGIPLVIFGGGIVIDDETRKVLDPIVERIKHPVAKKQPPKSGNITRVVAYAKEKQVSAAYLRGALYGLEVPYSILMGGIVIDDETRKVLDPIVERIKQSIQNVGGAPRRGKPRLDAQAEPVAS